MLLKGPPQLVTLVGDLELSRGQLSLGKSSPESRIPQGPGTRWAPTSPGHWSERFSSKQMRRAIICVSIFRRGEKVAEVIKKKKTTRRERK